MSNLKIKKYILPISSLSLAERIYLFHYSLVNLTLALESVSGQHYRQPIPVDKHWHTRRTLFNVQTLNWTFERINTSKYFFYNQRIVWVLKNSWLNKHKSMFKLDMKYCQVLGMHCKKSLGYTVLNKYSSPSKMWIWTV